MSTTAALARTRRELAAALGEAKRSWDWRGGAALAGFLLLAAGPLFLPGALSAGRLAEPAYLALAAIGLGFAVRAGLPSVGQGVFVGIGAVAAAHLAGRGWPLLASALMGAVLATAVGIALGAGVARLRPLFVAVVTWLASYGFALALVSFPRMSGGAQGLVVSESSIAGIELTPAGHYELALVLSALAVLGFVALARSPSGIELVAIAERPDAAATLGVPTIRRRIGAFAASAAVGGLAGGLSVHLAGVADPTEYGPFLSFELLVAVLLGGAASALGAPVGVAILTAISFAASALGVLERLPSGRFERAFDALILLLVLALGGAGLVPWLRELVARRLGSAAARSPRPAASRSGGGAPGPVLVARGLAKRFGSVEVVDGVDLELHPGRTTGLIGPNGSGKTTVLRLLAGSLQPDSGAIRLGEQELGDAPVARRVQRGVVRTLQATAVFPSLTALDHALIGAQRHSRFGGAARALFLTPRYRAEARAARAEALGALDAVGLAGLAEVPAARLSPGDQRLLSIAAALAGRPRVLLLDEPSAGAGRDELARLVAVLARLRAEGVAVLLVEHNLRLVRSVADEVVVLDAGRPLAAGPPDEIARDERVRGTYLGGRQL